MMAALSVTRIPRLAGACCGWRNGNSCAKDEAAGARGIHAQSAAECCDALAHAQQPHAESHGGVGRGLAVVIDVDLYMRALIRTGGLLHAKTKRDPRRCACFAALVMASCATL